MQAQAYQCQGLGLTPELLTGPVPKERRKFNDWVFAVLYMLAFLLTIVFLAMARSKYNSQISSSSNVIVNSSQISVTEQSQQFNIQMNFVQHSMNDHKRILITTTSTTSQQQQEEEEIQAEEKAEKQAEEQAGNVFSNFDSTYLTRVSLIFLGVLGIAAVVSAIFLWLTPKIVGCIVWSMIVLMISPIALLGVLLISQGQTPAAAVFLAMVAIYLVIVFCYREYIERAIIMIRIAANFFIEHPDSIFVSLCALIPCAIAKTMIFLSIFFAWEAYMYQAIDQNLYQAMQFVNIFVLYWSSSLFCSYAQLGIAIYFAYWFFSYKRGGSRTQMQQPLSSAISWPLTKHFGSMCFGSLLIAVIKMVELVLRYIEGDSDNVCVRWFLSCIINCIKQWLQRFTKVVMIMIALTGDSYCEAASDSFHLIFKKFGAFITLHSVTGMYTTVGCILVSCSAGVAGFFMLLNGESLSDFNLQDQAEYQLLVLYIIFSIFYLFVGLTVAHLFLTIISTGADCCLFYMTVDKELNRGQVMHGPDALIEIEQISAKHGKGYQNMVIPPSSTQQELSILNTKNDVSGVQNQLRQPIMAGSAQFPAKMLVEGQIPLNPMAQNKFSNNMNNYGQPQPNRTVIDQFPPNFSKAGQIPPSMGRDGQFSPNIGRDGQFSPNIAPGDQFMQNMAGNNQISGTKQYGKQTQQELMNQQEQQLEMQQLDLQQQDFQNNMQQNFAQNQQEDTPNNQQQNFYQAPFQEQQQQPSRSLSQLQMQPIQQQQQQNLARTASNLKLAPYAPQNQQRQLRGMPPNGTQQLTQSRGMPPNGTQQMMQPRGMPPNGTQQLMQSRGMPPNGTQQLTQSWGMPPNQTQQMAQSRGMPPNGQQLRGMPPNQTQQMTQSRGISPNGYQQGQGVAMPQNFNQQQRMQIPPSLSQVPPSLSQVPQNQVQMPYTPPQNNFLQQEALQSYSQQDSDYEIQSPQLKQLEQKKKKKRRHHN